MKLEELDPNDLIIFFIYDKLCVSSFNVEIDSTLLSRVHSIQEAIHTSSASANMPLYFLPYLYNAATKILVHPPLALPPSPHHPPLSSLTMCLSRHSRQMRLFLHHRLRMPNCGKFNQRKGVEGWLCGGRWWALGVASPATGPAPVVVGESVKAGVQ